MNTAPSPTPRRRGLRAVTVASIPALIITGLATLTAVGPAVAAELPAEAETFVVAQSAAGEMSETFMTSDGQRVFYTSTATDLVEGDDNGVSDIFVSVAAAGSDDPFSGPESLVSAPDGPIGATRANGASTDAAASANGRYVAFTSEATNLTDDPTVAGRSYVYVRDVVAERTFLVRGAEMPDGDSWDPDLTDDGRYLVFTSTATNFAPTGNFGRSDNFVADLDANSDGTLGDLSFTRVSDDIQLDAENASPRISGNGRFIYFLSSINGIWTPDFSIPTPYVNNLYRVERGRAGGVIVWGGPQSATASIPVPSVDATGHVVAFVQDFCDGDPSIAVSTWDEGFFTVAVGWLGIDRRVGTVSAPTISADGNAVAWATTQPVFDFGNSDDPQPLSTPVVRTEAPAWSDANSSIECTGITTRSYVEVGTGEWPSLSASGRTIAYTDGAVARAVDLHTHEGLSVTTVQAEVVDAGFMIGADTSGVPLTQLGEYASALADAPIYRLPIYRLPIYRLPIYRLPIYRLLIEDAPIYRLPIYRLPIYRLPIYRLDIPGGWAELLAATPFGGDLIQSVTLDEVLAWAAANIDSTDDAVRTAAERIQSLSLDDLDLDDSGLDSLSMASIVLGSAPVIELPIPGTGSNEDRWQALVSDQGIDLDVDGLTVLAELESAGLDIGRSGVDTIPLSSIPLAETLFDELQMASTADGPGLYLDRTPLGALLTADLDAATQTSLFGETVPDTSLEASKGALLPSATVADLAPGVPDDVTFGDLLFSLFDVESYPWEQVDPYDMIGASIGTSPGDCTSQFRCVGAINFRFTFDAGPGEPTLFPAPTATVILPPQTTPGGITAAATGPDLVSLSDYWSYGGPTQSDGSVVRFPLNDSSAGTTYSFLVDHPVTTTLNDGISTGILESRGLSASTDLSSYRAVEVMDDPTNERRNGEWFDDFRPGRVLEPGLVYYEWISPLYKELNDEGGLDIGPGSDEDWFRITPPSPGQRLIVSTNATDGQIAMALYRDGAPTAPLGTTDAGAVPATPVAEQTGVAGAQAASGADFAEELQGKTLVDQVSVGGDGIAQIEAASADTSPGEMLLRVSSGNGLPSSSLYSVRVRYLEEPAEVVCAPWSAATPDLMAGFTYPIDEDTNTLFIIDTQRFAATHGANATNEVLMGIAGLNGTGAVGSTVHGAVISVDTSPAVAAARSIADANPCSMQSREDLVTEINQYVASVIDGYEDQITSVVVVGGDDIVPFAPVGQNTSQFNEASHAANLRLTVPRAGGTCPEIVPEGTVDPCATPLSAAAATNYILTDDPYGLANAYETLGGHLYLPTVAVGRLVDSPAQITAALQRFVDTDGVLEADSTLTAGYGAWSELPDLVTSALEWRSGADQELEGTWDREMTEAALFPGDGESARVVSINTHADERRMLPGIPGAENGVFAENDLLEASANVDAPELANALVFLIGCHAGNNLPGSYYGADSADWADVFSTAGGYVGNTGFGLANNVTTALSERLLQLYADWVGVTSGGAAVSTAGALTLAKQDYLGQLGLYSGYDEKVLMQAVYYGLPMYTLSPAEDTKFAPLPTVPATLQPVESGTLGVMSAAVTLTPDFTVATDGQGNSLGYLVAEGQAPAVVPGQPVLPKIVSRLDAAPEGLAARGALITELTSIIEEDISVPAVTQPGVGIDQTDTSKTDIAFPSSYATVTRQETGEQPIDLLIVTPARVTVGQNGRGVVEKFTSMTVEATYGDSASTDDIAPQIQSVELPAPGGTTMYIRATDTQSPTDPPDTIAGMVLLVQEEGTLTWRNVTVERPTNGDEWRATVPEGPFRWILQVVDTAGNVATETARGKLAVASDTFPEYTTGGDSTAEVGSRFIRTIEVTDAAADEKLTATYTLTRETGSTEASGVAPVVTGPDGKTRVTIDQVISSPGQFTAAIKICRGTSCTPGEFALTVPVPNSAPSATVSISSNPTALWPTSVLTASALTTDPDEGDVVSVGYTWSVNGVARYYGETFPLNGYVVAGDVVAVRAIPNDGATDGHGATAEVTVVAAPPLPTIALTATNADGPYLGEDWSRSPVTIDFTCWSPVDVQSCTEDDRIDSTPPEGTLVSGTVIDSLARTATAELLIRVDTEGPTLAPTVTPATVNVGETPVVAANATDEASGIASQSCDEPNTTAPGTLTLTCVATDVAGNLSMASATYTVLAVGPAAPVITVTAKVGTTMYVAGTPTKGPVKLTYTCTSGVRVTSCPKSVTYAIPTGTGGAVVTGTMRDALGRTAEASILIRIDKKAPKSGTVAQ